MGGYREARVQDTYAFILEFYTKNRRAPTFDEIQRHCGVSKGTIANDIRMLVNRGLITKEPSGRISVSTSSDQRHFAPYVNFHRDETGKIIEEVIDTYELPNALFGNGDKQFLFRASGDAMVERRIYDGDILVVNRTEAQNGDIIIAMVGDNIVCRILASDADGNYLKAANRSIDMFGNRIFDIRPEKDLQILGVVRNVILLV